MIRPGRSVVAALVVMSGCLAPSPDLGLDSTDPSIDGSGVYVSVCPPAGATSGTVCVASLSHATDSYQEPYVARHPGRPEVIAIGVNTGNLVPLEPGRSTPGVRLALMRVLITEDGARTWRSEELPYVETPHPLVVADREYATGDPALVFDDSGMLHFAGMDSKQATMGGWRVFYTRSLDLGRSWSTPVLLTERTGVDREWIAVGQAGRVYVSWQDLRNQSSEIAWSHDSGQTWSLMRTDQRIPVCVNIGPVVEFSGHAFVACSRVASAGELQQWRATHVYRFDPATGDAHLDLELVHLVGPYPRLHVHPRLGLVVVVHDRPDLYLAHLAGLGSPWSLIGKLSGQNARDGPGWIYASEMGPDGRLHLLMGSPPPDFVGLQTSRRGPLVHQVIEPLEARTVSEALLSGGEALAAQRASQAPAPEYGDDFYGIAFHGAAAIAAWTHEKGIDYTFLEPRPS